MSYDQWKTASPYDDYDDEHCDQCGATLDLDNIVDGSEPEYYGYCSKECWQGVYNHPVVKPMHDLLKNSLGENTELWAKRVYKGTDCGASLRILSCTALELSSIVEGCNYGTETYTLEWPFTNDVFWNTLELIEEEAAFLWREVHEGDMINDK